MAFCIREFDFMTMSRVFRLTLASLGLAAILGCDSGGPSASNTTPTGPKTGVDPGTKSPEKPGAKGPVKGTESTPTPKPAD